MSTAKIIEISAESSKSFDDAIESGLARTGETIEAIQSAWIKDRVVLVDNGSISGYRVHMHVTFALK